MAKKKRKVDPEAPLSKTGVKRLVKRLSRKADSALSMYVRTLAIQKYQGLCPLCGKDPLQVDPAAPKKKNKWVCFHFVRRRCKILRWRLQNVVGACSRCNYVEYRNPDLSRAWFLREFGVDIYLALVDESVQSFEPTVEFLQDIITTYQLKLQQLALLP